MQKHRSAGGVIAFNEHIYALGGHDGLSIFDSVCYTCVLHVFYIDSMQNYKIFQSIFGLNF